MKKLQRCLKSEGLNRTYHGKGQGSIPVPGIVQMLICFFLIRIMASTSNAILNFVFSAFKNPCNPRPSGYKSVNHLMVNINVASFNISELNINCILKHKVEIKFV